MTMVERTAMAEELREIHRVIMRIDGDRDCDNGSDLSVGEACMVAETCKRIADYLEHAALTPPKSP